MPVSVREQFAEITTTNSFDALAGSLDIAVRAPAPFAIPRTNRSYATLKRIFDLIVAIPLLILTAPLMLAIALLIRLDSSGPIIFRQARLGLGGRPFGILKFRTMNVVEDGALIVQAARNDSRVTRVGTFLRASSLDELPQLVNVIIGEMSLVGPRPHAVAHDAIYGALIPQYAQRQSVKPGVTGWAQVNGLRGGTPTIDLMLRRVEFDVWYARHASITLDLKILLRTPLEMLRRRNAY
jgi:putative colanic acid biosynthesis UDP-glucose lipid carrier transferase